MENHFILKSIAARIRLQAIRASAISAPNQLGSSSPWVRKGLDHVGNQTK